VQPGGGKRSVVTGRLDLLQQAVDENLLLPLENGIFGVGGLAWVVKLLPGATGEGRFLLVLLVPVLQGDIEFEPLPSEAFSGITEELGSDDFILAGHPPLR
jgi:hypothetical protein